MSNSFVPGSRVALITRGYSGRERVAEGKVDKVHKSGNFTLVGGDGRQWRPTGKTTAHLAGGSRRYQLHVELWSAEIDALIAANAEKRRVAKIVEEVKEKIDQLRTDEGYYRLGEAQVAAVEGLLATLTLPPIP